MKFSQPLLAVAALIASFGAQAQVTGSLGGGYGTFLSLSSAGLAGGSVATLSGGTVYTSDMPFADVPAGVIFGGNFLAAGPTSGAPATLTFAGVGIDYISFLWGSPDSYNVLTVNSTGGSQTFTAPGLGFSTTNGDQSFSQYVQFTAASGFKITSLTFDNLPMFDAFETANYSITPVPEPQTYAMLFAGLAAIGFAASRRSGRDR
jgi:PEP-CTERM motif